jgi:diguanylate cyclase (GGDEF)-like protein
MSNNVFGSVWLTVLSFEALLFTISIAFILLAMAKERTELRHRTAAMIDPLTGISNRRAFLQGAGQIAKRHMGHPKPTAVLLVDLDHFKSINDRFGHATGDRVLEIFAETARQSIRTTDLVGRLGGEEFAVLLPDLARDKALFVAEKLRASFEEASQQVDGEMIGCTVSIGIAFTDGPVLEIPGMLAQADQALYFAKERGRNRVEVASLDLVLDRKKGDSAPATKVAAA